VIFTADKWREPIDFGALFGRRAPVEIDLGCGKGRFLTARASACPDRDFIGTDRQFSRLQKIRRKAERLGLSNVRLLHAETAYALRYLFSPSSVSACYLFFPDPWPKRKHHRRRIVTPAFMDILARILQADAPLHVATDHDDYFAWVTRIIAADSRFEPSPPFVPTEEEKTDFEVLFTAQGRPVFRVSCRRRDDPALAAPSMNRGLRPGLPIC